MVQEPIIMNKKFAIEFTNERIIPASGLQWSEPSWGKAIS